MKRKKLLWQLYPYFLIISLVAILGVSWYASRVLYRFHVSETEADLIARASLLGSQFTSALLVNDSESIDAICKELGSASGTRITVILPSGSVAGDSDENPLLMDNHGGRPEVKDAVGGRESVFTRQSPTLRSKMTYAAVPIVNEGEIIAVVRTSLPLVVIQDAFRTIALEIALGAFFLILLAGIGSFSLSQRISGPLAEMKRGADRFASGDLTGRVPVPDSEEVGGLADALNSLAVQLGDKISQLEQQRNEQAAVFSSMVEGVIAVDEDEKIINLNSAAARMFKIELDQVKGRGLHEVVRNTDLQRLLAETLHSNESIEGDIVLPNGGDRHLQAHGTTLLDSEGRSIGALLVLNDITRLRRLETVRRDFVANVSHELKTPITSIKGFVETLIDGAMKKPAESERFLDIIAKQSDRLDTIIDDLLILSRIEQEAESGAIELTTHPLRSVLASASQLCQLKAQAKDVGLVVDCSCEAGASVNPQMLEQAVANLVDNAVKYSKAGDIVKIACQCDEEEVVISVRDQGCGIEQQHHPRLFERFYRVDKARSREMGGTGLGLAIVKHIVQAHGGYVTLDSTPGEGSAFFIHLPLSG